MLRRAQAVFDQAGLAPADIVRIDVPGRGSDAAERVGNLRPEVEPALPALQSGSLFGGVQGLLIVDVHALLKAEAEVIAELMERADPQSVLVIFVSSGALPSLLASVVKTGGEVLKVAKLREKDAASWLAAELRSRGLRMPEAARSALMQRFGSDVAAMAQALDQLEASGRPITADTVLARFKNRPDEPMWHYADAVAAGKVSDALRRLTDFLTYGHPLQLLGYLEDDLRRRALAAASPNLETFTERVGGRAGDWRVERDWKRRKQVSDSELRRALGALVRADGLLKSAPEESHRLTMERLTVALCRLYGGRPAQVG
jgi:DNA polymerase III delta subunit